MKVSSKILLVTFVLLIAFMFVSNLLLKKEYDKIDKSDIYWTYEKILQAPFRHLVITGGNLTNIAFEQNKTPSVRVFKNWDGLEKKSVKAYVRHDTLFVRFPAEAKDIYEKRYMNWYTLVRIFSPELLSVDGFDTNFGLFKLKQKNIDINLSGKSKLEVESDWYQLDNIHVRQQDSSAVVFEMSPELKGTNAAFARKMEINELPIMPGTNVEPHSWETMYIRSVDADLRGMSVLDLGHAQIDSIQLKISDTSAILVSGGTLQKLKKSSVLKSPMPVKTYK